MPPLVMFGRWNAPLGPTVASSVLNILLKPYAKQNAGQLCRRGRGMKGTSRGASSASTTVEASATTVIGVTGPTPQLCIESAPLSLDCPLLKYPGLNSPILWRMLAMFCAMRRKG